MRQPIPLSLLVVVGIIVATVLALAIAQRPHGKVSGTSVLDAVENLVGRFLMVGMLYAATLQVLTRYWLSQYFTLPWTEEFSRLLMVWAGLWGAAIVQRSNDHISVNLVPDFLPRSVRRAIRLFSDLVFLVVLIPVFWLGLQAAAGLGDLYTIALGMSMWVFATAVPATVALMMIYTVTHVIRGLRDWSLGTGDPD